MSEFEARLSECLEAVREGRWDVEECLRRYPADADALRPHLVTAAAVRDAYRVEPGEEFARRSRERFLVATGQRLREAYDVGPDLSFFAAARVRFLMTAHRMRGGERRPSPRLPAFVGRHFRAVAGAAAVLILFLSFSTYTVASANSALPGDWQYPVKLQTERVRLALTFGEDARRQVRLDIAEERAREIQTLHREGRHIGPGVINRLVEQTKPLIDGAGPDWDTKDLARLQAVAEYEKLALQQAQPSIDPAAHDAAQEAVQLSVKAVTVSNELLLRRSDRPAIVVTPGIALDALTQTATPTATPSATPTPAASDTPQPALTPAATPSSAPPVSQSPGPIDVNPTPELVRGEVHWIRLAAANVTTLIPSPADGWSIGGIASAPVLIHLSNATGTSLITLNTTNGDMYWFISRAGRFDEVQMRIRQADGQVLVVDRDFLRAVYGGDAEIPLFVLENLEVRPAAAPAPSTPQSLLTPAATP
jgi:hypothetical protein